MSGTAELIRLSSKQRAKRQQQHFSRDMTTSVSSLGTTAVPRGTSSPDSGAYVNECDYFQENWQRAFWGPNYPRLARIKRRYDPDGLFSVYHGVGSEAWSADGFVRLP
jgi:Berberine and berberine like